MEVYSGQFLDHKKFENRIAMMTTFPFLLPLSFLVYLTGLLGSIFEFGFFGSRSLSTEGYSGQFLDHKKAVFEKMHSRIGILSNLLLKIKRPLAINNFVDRVILGWMYYYLLMGKKVQ